MPCRDLAKHLALRLVLLRCCFKTPSIQSREVVSKAVQRASDGDGPDCNILSYFNTGACALIGDVTRDDMGCGDIKSQKLVRRVAAKALRLSPAKNHSQQSIPAKHGPTFIHVVFLCAQALRESGNLCSVARLDQPAVSFFLASSHGACFNIP